MIKREFKVKATPLNIWNWLGLFFLFMIIGGIVALSIPGVRNMFWPRNLLIVSIMHFLVLLTLYFIKFELRIVCDTDSISIYKNNKVVYEKSIDEIEKFHGGNIDDNIRNMGELYFFFAKGERFHFSNILSSKEIHLKQSLVVKSLVRYFMNEYGFVKQDHYTKLGKSKYIFMYVNPKYLKEE